MFIDLLKTAHAELSVKSRREEYKFITYGILGFFGFAGFYFFNLFLLGSDDPYENIYLRCIASGLSFLLIVKNYWPAKLKALLPLCWYLTLIHNLPFFFTFMYLKNSAVPIWHLYSMSAFMFLMLLVDWLSFAVISVVGIALGTVAYLLTTPNPQFPENSVTIAIVYLTVICYGTLFSQKNEAFQKKRLRTIKLLASSMAYELRTPLSAIGVGVQTLRQLWPFYRDAYVQAVDAQLPVRQLTLQQQQDLDDIPQNLQALTQNTYAVINMLLTNVSEGNLDQQLEVCSMGHCIDEALQAYPFSLHELPRIRWERSATGFWFNGDRDLMKHVIFNLLKNALAATAKKGEIFVSLEPGKRANRVVFKDTGKGIPRQELNYIFDQFYTRTNHGTGIGLAFCQSVLKGWGGIITCDSVEGEHTVFTLTLPILTLSHPVEPLSALEEFSDTNDKVQAA